MKNLSLPPEAGIAVSMIIFGTIGIFRTYIPLESGAVAFIRGILGAAFLFLFIKLTGKKVPASQVRKKLPLLILSGALIGFNWIFLFESYRYAGVSTGTLCYYMSPVFLIAASPLLGERYSVKKLSACAVALVGMVLVTGIYKGNLKTDGQGTGILLGLSAAVLYASVIFINKKIGETEAFTKTAIQLGAASVAILPYVWIKGELTGLKEATPKTVILLLIVGLVHTGFAYALYFGGVGKVKAQTAALLSYTDPATALILSAVFLKEDIGVSGVIGAVLIIGAAVVSSIEKRQRHEA